MDCWVAWVVAMWGLVEAPPVVEKLEAPPVAPRVVATQVAMRVAQVGPRVVALQVARWAAQMAKVAPVDSRSVGGRAAKEEVALEWAATGAADLEEKVVDGAKAR